MNDQLNKLLERQGDARTAAELARVLADALDDVRAGWGNDRPY